MDWIFKNFDIFETALNTHAAVMYIVAGTYLLVF